MKNRILLCFNLLFFIAACSSIKTESIIIDMDGILENYAEEYYALNPLEATKNGINTYNDQLAISISDEYIEKLISFNNRYLDTLKSIQYESLTKNEKLSFQILKSELEIETEGLANKYLWITRPVDQFAWSFPQQFAVLASGAAYVPFNTEIDYRNFISRMKAYMKWTDKTIGNLQAGLELKNTPPKAAMQKVPEQLRPLYEKEGPENILYQPLQNLPVNMDSAAKANLISDYSRAIERYLKPAYKKLNNYLENTYIPNARESTGLLDNSGGRKEYDFWLRKFTTTDISADSIFKLGLSEVARIRKEIDSLRISTGFEGDLSKFFQYIRTNSKFFPFDTEEEVLDRYRSFEARMEPQLKKLFNKRPDASFEVRATEKFREGGSNAQYSVASRDGRRPGVFYETVRNPSEYNVFQMEALFMHEAIPGHHYQLALQQEAKIPEFRKSYFNTAYVEGWALYAESLGKELGMYTNPYQYMGRLNLEMERAVRLVVDAGMHSKGWSREKAIAYVLENQPVTLFTAEQRIERYMVVPGQATSYKIGELKIIQLREKSRKALGNQFDIREFHDEILKDGAMPLTLLEVKIDWWLAQSLN